MPNVTASGCVVGASPTLRCPADNTVEGTEPEVIGEYPKVDCKICGIHALVPRGLSGGAAIGSLIFGRNQKDGQVNESMISSYRAYPGDSSGNKLNGSYTASLPVATSSEACCGHAYNLSTSFDPSTSIPASVVVVPVDVNGYEMPVGEFFTVDRAGWGIGGNQDGVGDASQARQESYLIGSLAVAAFLWIRTVG